MGDEIVVSPERTSALTVGPGLYVIRYADAPQIGAPVGFVRASPGSESFVKFIYPPHAASCLSGPGSVVVALVDQRSGLQFTIKAIREGGSLDAKFEVDQLDKAAVSESGNGLGTAPFSDGARAGHKPEIAFVPHLEVSGHVTRRGDIHAGRGVWIAGPDDPARIEGIALRMSAAPFDAVLEYQVQIARSPNWTSWVANGEFAGTRGQSKAITGVRFRLSGRDASVVALRCSGLFLGSAMIEKNGSEIELRSASGVDPLIGLRLDIQKTVLISDAEPVTAPKGRVRVFRAGTELPAS